MGYNIAESGTLNEAASNYKIASDAYVSYTPDYKKLVIRGNGNNYGICYTGMTVDSGGFLDMGNRAYVSALTVLSGGTAVGAGWGAWRDITVSAGGSVQFLNAKIHGNFDIAQGAIVGDADAYASGGIFYNWDNSLSLDVYDGVGFSNCSLGGAISMTAGTTVRDVTAGGTLYAYDSCTIYNITATAGNFRVGNYWVNFNFGGADTNIAAGHWTNDANVYVTSGVIHNLNLHKEGSTVQRVTLTEGIVGEAVIVGDSGVLTVGSAGSASGAIVTSNGTLYVAANGEVRNAVVSSSGQAFFSSGAKSYDAVVSEGGKLTVSYGAIASGVTVMNGGSAAYVVSSWYRPEIIGLVVSEGGTATAENYVPWKSLDIKTGGVFSCTGNVKIYGTDINIAEGTWAGCGDAIVVNGEIRNYIGAKGFDVFDGAGISGGSFGGYVSMTSNTTMRDAAVTNGGQTIAYAGGVISGVGIENGGKGYVSSGATADGVKVSAGGNMYVYSAGTARNTVVSDGGTLTCDSNVIVSGVTVLEGGKMNASGNGAYTAPFYEGVIIESGGYIDMFNRARISGLIVRSGGTAAGAGWGTWKNLTVESGGSVTFNAAKIYGSNYDIAKGAITNCATAYASGGVFYDFDTNLSFDVYDQVGFCGGSFGGTVSMTSGTSVKDVMIGGTLNIYAGATADGVTVKNGGKAYYIASGSVRPDIEGLVVENGGLVSANDWCGWKSLDVQAGATFSAGAAKIYGTDINIAQGTWANYAAAYAVSGVIYGLDTSANGSGFDLFSGTVLSNARLGGYTSLSLGAEARDVVLTNANRGLAIRGGCLAYNVDATVGKIYLEEYWNNVRLGGGQTEIAAGNVYYNGAGGTGAPDNDLYATSGVLYNLTVRGEGAWMRDVTLVEGITAAAPVVSGGLFTVCSGATASDLVVSSGTAKITAGGVIDGVDVLNGSFHLFDGPEATGTVRDGIVAENVRVSGGQAFVRGSNALGSNYTVLNGLMYVQNGATADGIEIAGGTVSAYVNNNELCVDYDADAATVENVTLTTGNLNIGDRGIADSVAVAGGSMSVNTSGAAMDVEQTGGRIIVNGSGATIDGATVYGGNMSIGNGGALNDATISGGTVVVRHVAGWAATTELKSAVASDVRVETGAGLTLESGGILQAGKLADGATLTVYKGGQAGLASAAAGAVLNLSFWDVNSGATGNEHGLISEWGDFSSSAKVNIQSIDFGGTSYKIADEANANVTLDVIGYHDIYQIAVKSGRQYSNAFWGMNFDFSDGMTLATDTFSVGVEATAAALGTGTATALADGGFAAIWTANTDTSGVSVVADADTTGDAWVTVNGASLATPLYGAEGNFAHDVNMWIYEGTVRNLAAGATAGGSVENVNLLISDNGEGTDKLTFTGVAYLGGFGNVTGEVKAAVYGGSFQKDFYAGALANKLTTTTSVGDVSMTVNGGAFSGNIYGASAVKTDTTKGNGTRHTAGDVTLTVTGGETSKGAQACIFAGGYATGDATGTVYTVDSVTATISGGSWGTAAGGRGVFGGIMASGVEAEVLGNVNITISGDATMGNVYGGGWAQKNGTSIVGDVNINIEGGTIANVFGGGSHSTSGGSTEAGDITITVSGGNITGTIYARGQLDGDTTGAANVIFTGTTDFSCDVFGYSYVGGEASDATLAFSTYAGEFSGSIGGFNSIAFDGNTALTLTTAQDKSVSNKAWEFDFTKRDAEFSDIAFLSGAILSESNSVAVSFADETQAKGGWSIAGVTVDTGASATFDLTVGTDTIATDLAYGTAISGGTYDGWGFELESGVLKFKNLA